MWPRVWEGADNTPFIPELWGIRAIATLFGTHSLLNVHISEPHKPEVARTTMKASQHNP